MNALRVILDVMANAKASAGQEYVLIHECMWMHVPSRTFLFSDETGRLDDGRYNTYTEAVQAMQAYALQLG